MDYFVMKIDDFPFLFFCSGIEFCKLHSGMDIIIGGRYQSCMHVSDF